jgi:plastocyanin
VTRSLHFAALSGLTATCALGLGVPAFAATLTNQTPNIDTPMTTPVGEVYFPFTHRFIVSGGKVTNSPTFTLTTGVTPWADLAVRYATNSDINGNFNEWEALAKARLGPLGMPVGVTAMAGYNTASSSVDAAILGAYDVGPIGLRLTGRGFSNGYGVGGPTLAAGGGVIWHLNSLVALGADVNNVLYAQNMAALQPQATPLKLAWSAAVTADLPYSPHSLSLYVTNANTHTMEGMSRGVADLHYGFEFMIPFTNLGRYGAWVHPGDVSAVGANVSTPTAAKPTDAVKAVEIAQFKFTPDDVKATAGTTIRWTNRDAIAHTVSADDGSFESGLIASGANWAHTFDKAGDYAYHCAPHPFMKGVIHIK